jgi:hypothetical protein
VCVCVCAQTTISDLYLANSTKSNIIIYIMNMDNNKKYTLAAQGPSSNNSSGIISQKNTVKIQY